MCGIYGVCGQGIQKQDMKIFHDLAILNLFRGQDATGLYFGNTRINRPNNNGMHSFKIANDATYLFFRLFGEANKKLRTEFESVSNTLYMGHNRAATIGGLVESNAHPFEFDRLVGMHNGTLVDDEFIDDKDGRTDSELLFKKLNANEGKEVDILSRLDKASAWALSIYDKKKKKLYLGTNGKRPLSFAISTERGVMYWSSEELALEYVLKRNKVKYIMYDLNERYLFEIDPTDIRSTESYQSNSYKSIKVADNAAKVSILEHRKKQKEEEEKKKKKEEGKKTPVTHVYNSDKKAKHPLGVPNFQEDDYFHDLQSTDERYNYGGVAVH